MSYNARLPGARAPAKALAASAWNALAATLLRLARRLLREIVSLVLLTVLGFIWIALLIPPLVIWTDLFAWGEAFAGRGIWHLAAILACFAALTLPPPLFVHAWLIERLGWDK